MKSLNFGASLAPRIVFAASNNHVSRVEISKCSLFSDGKGRVVWVVSTSVFFFGKGSFPLENSFQLLLRLEGFVQVGYIIAHLRRKINLRI